jgi:hypothetical protein
MPSRSFPGSRSLQATEKPPLSVPMNNKSPNIEWLTVHPGKTFEQLLRMDLTPEQRKAYDKMREDCAFYKFAAELAAERFKNRRSSILGKLAAEDLKLYVNKGLLTIIQGDAARLITQAVSQGDEAFFKAFGRAVTGKKFNTFGLDNYNKAIARLIYDGNTESGRRKLKKDFPQMEANFRVYRERLLDALPPKYQYLDHRKKQRKQNTHTPR